MSDQKKLIVDGNAFYELDMDCMNRKRNRRDGSRTDKDQKSNVGPRKSVSREKIKD